MKKTFNFAYLFFVVMSCTPFVLVAAAPVAEAVTPDSLSLKFTTMENMVLKKVGTLIAGNKSEAARSIVEQHQALTSSVDALGKHVVMRDPVQAADPAVHHEVKKNVIEKLKAKIDPAVFKTAHSFGQAGPLRTLIDKVLEARVAWAKEGTQLKKFLAINGKEFEKSLANFFEEMQTGELYQLVSELKAILEFLHDALPDGKTLLAGIRANTHADAKPAVETAPAA